MVMESEEDASMEVDGEVPTSGAPAKKDDLAEYNLDEYDDDDVKEEGVSVSVAWGIADTFLRRWSIQQYQRINFLQR
jgi:hypothetical protein